MTHAEAAAIASGEIVTIREGAKTHQAIQTNLADVICGGKLQFFFINFYFLRGFHYNSVDVCIQILLLSFI